jgi:hypothetical protein
VTLSDLKNVLTASTQEVWSQERHSEESDPTSINCKGGNKELLRPLPDNQTGHWSIICCTEPGLKDTSTLYSYIHRWTVSNT